MTKKNLGQDRALVEQQEGHKGMSMKQKIFEGTAKIGKSWVGTYFQKKGYRDKFGYVRKGESRRCDLYTDWGSLSIPNYKDVNKFGNKLVRITVELVEPNMKDKNVKEAKGLKRDIKTVVGYLWHDEEKHYEEMDNPKNHIFLTLKRLKARGDKL